MSLLDRAIARMGEAQLQKLVGPGICSMLLLLGEKAVTAKGLAALVGSRDPSFLVLDRRWRSEILRHLSRDDADRLLFELTGRSSDDPWRALLSLRFSPTQRHLLRLADILGIEMEPGTRPEQLAAVSYVRPAYPLFSHQRQAVSDLKKLLESENRRAVLHMPTGSGKTRTAMNLVCSYLKNAAGIVLWLAHSEELCDQACEEFAAAWGRLGDRSVRLARMYGVYSADLAALSDGLLVGGLQKVYARSLSDQQGVLAVKDHLRLTVFDEAHLALAPTYSHVLSLLSPDERHDPILGLTATPGRGSGQEESEALAQFFFRNKVTLQVDGYDDPVSYLQDKGYLSRARYEYVHVDSSIELQPKDLGRLAEGFDFSADFLAALAVDEARNLLILERIVELAEEGRAIIVFACSVDHAEFLADVLNLKSIGSTSVTARSTPEARRKAIERFRAGTLSVLTNFGVLTTGFDAPNADTAVVARPTRSVVLYSQMVGRVLRGRRAGGTEEALVVSVVDRIPGFRNIIEGFTHWDELW